MEGPSEGMIPWKTRRRSAGGDQPLFGTAAPGISSPFSHVSKWPDSFLLKKEALPTPVDWIRAD